MTTDYEHKVSFVKDMLDIVFTFLLYHKIWFCKTHNVTNQVANLQVKIQKEYNENKRIWKRIFLVIIMLKNAKKLTCNNVTYSTSLLACLV